MFVLAQAEEVGKVFGFDKMTLIFIGAAVLLVVFWPKIAEAMQQGTGKKKTRPTEELAQVRVVADEVKVEPPLKDEVAALLKRRDVLDQQITELRKILTENA